MRLSALIAVLFLAWLPLWAGLGSHPLHQRSESRYAVVALNMLHSAAAPDVADVDNAERTIDEAASLDALLIPRFHGNPHLTKPPLQYWLIAASMKVFGATELAVRLPSALAASLTVLGVWWLAWRLHDAGTAAACAAMLSVMPVFVVVGRLALTDGLLALCWLGTLGGAVMMTMARSQATVAPRTANTWALASWTFVAVGLLVKGPLALLPAGVVLVWLIAARRGDVLKVYRPWWGLPLACVPLLLWVAAVCWRLPGGWSAALDVWEHEIVDRATGSGDHPEPWWYLWPVFVVALFPAVTQWPVPGVHVTWRRVCEAVRAGEPSVLWTLGMLAPLVLFTLFSGKLMTYVLPGAACGALLAGPVLMRWVRAGRVPKTDHETADAVKHLPVGGLGVIVIGAVLAGVVLIVVVRRGEVPVVPPWAVWPVLVWMTLLVSAWLMVRVMPAARGVGLVVAWVATAGVYVTATVIETQAFNQHSTPSVVAALRGFTHYDRPRVLTVGYTDESLAFYTGRDTSRVDPRFMPEAWSALDKRQLVLLAEPDQWAEFRALDPALVDGRYRRIGHVSHLHADPIDKVDGDAAPRVDIYVLREARRFNAEPIE